MLSRLAELIYWAGRYVERADDTSRIVDAYIHRIAEDPFGDRGRGLSVAVRHFGHGSRARDANESRDGASFHCL